MNVNEDRIGELVETIYASAENISDFNLVNESALSLCF